MKLLSTLSLLLTLCTVHVSQAQTHIKVTSNDVKHNKDTTRFKIGRHRFVIISDSAVITKNATTGDSTVTKHKKKKDHYNAHWAGFEMGFNGYLNKDMGSSMPIGYDYLKLNPGKSVAVQLNFFEKYIPIYSRYIGVVTGLGLEWNNFRFDKNNTFLSASSDSVKGGLASGNNVNYTKSKLTVNYINIPILIEFNTHKKEIQSFHLAAGVVVGYMYRAHTKMVYEENGHEVKAKEYADFNINPFKYSLTARIGYGSLNIFANYGLNGLFKDNTGPELHPFTVGMTLIGF